MKIRFLAYFVLLAACRLALAGHSDAEYKTGTLISWAAGGTKCSGVAVAHMSAANCNPGGDNLYRVTIEGHEYQLTRGDQNEGLLDKKPDPLRSLLPADKFQYRIERQKAKLWVLEKNGKEGHLVATVTPTHLLYDRRQAFSGGYRPLIHMKPLVKTREDRERVRDIVKKGLPFISAGTDSAPHPEGKKFSSCCAFGTFTSPVAVEVYTEVFDELGCLDKLENFLSINGPHFYGVEPSTETTTLIKKDWQISEPVVTDEGVKIWSICNTIHGLGNETIHWKIA